MDTYVCSLLLLSISTPNRAHDDLSDRKQHGKDKPLQISDTRACMYVTEVEFLCDKKRGIGECSTQYVRGVHLSQPT